MVVDATPTERKAASNRARATQEDGAAADRHPGVARKSLNALVENLRSALASELKGSRKELRRKHAQVEKLRSELKASRKELTELRSSYYLAGARKKLDIRTVQGFSQLAQEAIDSGRTSMSYDRLYTLWQAVRVVPAGGPFVEVGAYRGGSARFIAETLKAFGQAPPIYVCDTFAGHPRTDPDIDTRHLREQKFAKPSFDDVEEYLAAYPNIEILVGDIIETSERMREQSFAFVHIDVDVYPATQHCLRFFTPRLAPGAILVLDDYGHLTCPGVKQAADEFVAENAGFRLIHLLTAQAIIVRS